MADKVGIIGSGGMGTAIASILRNPHINSGTVLNPVIKDDHDVEDDALIPTKSMDVIDFNEDVYDIREAFLTPEQKILKEFRQNRKAKSVKRNKKKTKIAKKSRQNNRKRK